MNFKLLLRLSLIIVITFSCSSNNTDSHTPNYSLIKEFEIDSTKLTYQYYQAFGFNETCEDLRLVFNTNKKVELRNQLPINQSDLKRINEFDNKIDKLVDDSISFAHNSRAAFKDIEIDFIKYIKDSSVSVTLQKGTYELEIKEFKSMLKVYDEETNNLYIEIHRCDGN